MAEEVSRKGAIVPVLFRWEVQNALIVAERKGRLSRAIVEARCADLDALKLLVDAQSASASFGTGLDLARQLSLSAYDAAYLELAVRHREPLMTRDERLAKAAESFGLRWRAEGPRR